MNVFERNMQAYRRHTILRFLIDANGSATETLILLCLEDVQLSAGLTPDAVREDVRFLAEQGLVKVEDAEKSGTIVKLTERGEYVEKGRIRVEGITCPPAGRF